MSGGPIQITRHGSVLEVVLNRPRANAIDAPTSRLMGKAFAEFRDDPELRVAIITGNGDKFFCAGWDLKAGAAGEAPDSDYGVGGFGGIQELPNLNKPIIAAVNGMAVGGGFELALSADLIIAADHARFSLPEINSGTLADAATLRLPKRIAHHIAMDMLFTGRWMDCREAMQRGVINDAVPGDVLMTRARELAIKLAEGPPLVFAAIKEVARESENMQFSDAMRRIYQRRFHTVDILYSSEDQLEGARAFAEKRAPVWQGR